MKATLNMYIPPLLCSGLERRLKARVPRQRGEGVPEGRSNLKPSEEDFWHAAGAYDDVKASGKTASTVAPGEAACGEALDIFSRSTAVYRYLCTSTSMVSADVVQL